MNLPSSVIHLRPPRRWNLVSAWIVALAFMAGGLLVRWLASSGHLDSVWQVFAVVGASTALLAGAGLLAYGVLRPRATREIRLGDASVRLPAGQHSPRILDVPYTRIFGLERMERTRWPRVVIGVRGRTPIAFADRAFEEPGDGERLLEELRRRIASLPDGEERLRAIDARRRIQMRAFRGTWPVTPLVLLLLAGVFGLEVWRQAVGNAAGLAWMGGQVPLLVRDGQWWRLFTANLLHMDLTHLYMNGVGLLALGFLIERLLGSLRFAWVLLVGALVSAAASAAFGDHTVSVGASGAIFALVGAWLLLNVRHREDLPPALCLPVWYIVGLAVLEIVTETLIPNVDTVAHAGGLCAGIWATRFALPERSLERSLLTIPRGVRWGTALLGLAFAGSVATGAWSVLYGGDAYTVRFVTALLETSHESVSDDDVAINELTWLLATSEDPPRRGLELAIERMQEVAARNPEEPHYLDTLATLHHRAGDSTRAVLLERRALASASPQSAPLYASQLARFHARRLQAHGVLGSDTWEGPLPTLERVPAEEGESGEVALAVDLGGPLERGATLEVLVFAGDALHSLLRVDLAPRRQPVARLTSADDAFARLPEDARLELALVEMAEARAADGTLLAPGRWVWRSYPHLPSVARLPGPI